MSLRTSGPQPVDRCPDRPTDLSRTSADPNAGFPVRAWSDKSHGMRSCVFSWGGQQPGVPLRPLSRTLLVIAMLAAGWPVPSVVRAQRIPPGDTLRDSTGAASRLQGIRVTGLRDVSRSPFELPYAVSTAPMGARPALRRTGLGDLLAVVPGVQAFDRANPSQDPRLTIRGFGARSAFGTRGVRVLRDGIPVSLPDGQTPLDWVDLETIERVEVVRGTAAALYGNAAGGVVDVRSREIPRGASTGEAKWWEGGGMRRLHALTTIAGHDSTGVMQQPRALLAFTRTQGDGARQWSRLDASSAFGRVQATLGGTRLEVQGTYYDAPRAENTGALTAAELARDPRLPDSLNITKRSRKAVTHSMLAALAERDVPNGTVRANAFVGGRRLDNPLPFAMVDVNRTTAGGGVHGVWRTARMRWPVRLGLGVDVQEQDDARRNFENCADLSPSAPRTVRCPLVAERGALRLDQQERVLGWGGYGRFEIEADPRLLLSAALRADRVQFEVRDRFVTATNPNDSGDRTLGAVTPMFGLVWRPRSTWSWYTNVSQAFETPTITELTNQEDGAAGLNRALDPQRTRTVEVGTQALIGDHVRIEAAGFRAVILDELVPFDVPNQPGRRAFRNAGRSARRGAEVGVRGVWAAVDAGLSYTWSRFRFDSYQVGTASYAGRAVPGIAPQVLNGFATVRRGVLFGTVESMMTARMTADDAGTISAAGSAVWHLRAGLEGARVGAVRIDPTIGVENLFDRRYAGSLVVNATRGRFFEPGLPRRFTMALHIR